MKLTETQTLLPQQQQHENQSQRPLVSHDGNPGITGGNPQGASSTQAQPTLLERLARPAPAITQTSSLFRRSNASDPTTDEVQVTVKKEAEHGKDHPEESIEIQIQKDKRRYGTFVEDDDLRYEPEYRASQRLGYPPGLPSSGYNSAADRDPSHHPIENMRNVVSSNSAGARRSYRGRGKFLKSMTIAIC